MSYALPQVGDIITVKTYYKSHVIGRTEEDDTTTYEKVCVAPSFAWTKTNAFCIPAEGEPYITKRTISLNSVVDLIVHKGSDAEGCTSGTKFVKVPGSKGNEYMVTVVDGFGTECECLGFHYGKNCKHLKIAQEAA